MSTRFLKHLLVLLTLGLISLAGCSSNNIGNVPADFSFVMDVSSAEDLADCPVNINIRIDARGRGQYDYYDTECAIVYDTNHIVTYKQGQILKSGELKLSAVELEGLWNAIEQNNFFGLTEDYRMEMGFSYAFIMVEANGQTHIVDNIGMEIPEMRAMVEATNALMPEDVSLEYGEGFNP